MAIRIDDNCINCTACESECPNNAIYEPGFEWRFSDGTNAKGLIKGLSTGIEADADEAQVPKSMDFYYIVTDKCTECKGFNDEPACVIACPVDACVKDDDHVETEEQLLAKKQALHLK